MQTASKQQTLHDVLAAIQAGRTFELPFKTGPSGAGNAYWIWGHQCQATTITLGPEHSFEARVASRGPFRGWLCCKLVFPSDSIPPEAVTQAPMLPPSAEMAALLHAARSAEPAPGPQDVLYALYNRLASGRVRTEGSEDKVVAEVAICPDDVEWSQLNPTVFESAEVGVQSALPPPPRSIPPQVLRVTQFLGGQDRRKQGLP